MSCCFLEVQGQVKVRCGERKGVSTGITSELGRRHPLLAHSFSNLLSLSFPSTRHLLKKTSTVNKAKEPTMPLFAPRRSPRNHQTLGDKIATAFRSNGRSHRQNRVAGLKAARSNPRISAAGRKRAKLELNMMGQKANHVPLGTRIRHALHLPAKSSRNKRF